MPSLSGQQKKKLKATAHHLKPVIYIGKNGVSDSVVSALDKSLSDHELIKIRFGDFKDEKKGLIRMIVEKTSSELVAIIGNTAILYRPNND